MVENGSWRGFGGIGLLRDLQCSTDDNKKTSY